jgi:UDP-N-acetylmuramate dehydrogenase
MHLRYDGIVRELRGKVVTDEPLSLHTSLKVGGPADLYVVPVDLEDLQRLLMACKRQKLPWLVIGGGYNMLVRDGGYRGVVISLKQLDSVERLPGDRVRIEAGVSNQRLMGLLEVEGLTGLEFLAGIPGTMGGALAMNAGCLGHEVMDATETLQVMYADGFQVVSKQDLEHGYRFLRIKEGGVIAGATFQLTADDPSVVAGRVRACLEKRLTTQKVIYPNAGSFFKNPEGKQAWRLIDDAGLRGMQVGGAQISEAHANFLVNRGTATASDFLSLAKVVKERVKATSGFELEEEVRIVGEG